MRTTRRISSPAFRYSPLVAALAMALAPQMAAAATIVVNTTSDSGAGSLRQAILDANANCASDPAPTITFAIPGTGPFVILPSTDLPEFICTANSFWPTIDGYSQLGSSRNTLADGFNANIQIIIDGSSTPGLFCGLYRSRFDPGGSLTVQGLEIRNFNGGLCGSIRAFGNRIRGTITAINLSYGNNNVIGDGTAAGRNVMGDNSGEGIYIDDSTTATSIAGNFIGTLDGVTAAPNGSGIILVSTAPKLIRNNVISGNSYAGIETWYDAGTSISGNKIGVDASGTSPLPNQYGIMLNYSYGDAFNPGTSIASNTISGNSSKGVWLLNNSDKVTLTSNKIGTDSSGMSAIGNYLGVFANCGAGHTLSGNVISGNSWNGVEFGGIDASSLTGNRIGVGSDGVTAIGNGGSGVVLDSWDCAQMGSNNALSSNTIAKNGYDGVLLLGFGTGNSLSQNSIYDNGLVYGGKNININSSPSPLPNDPAAPPSFPFPDMDGGPNNQQNWPAIDSVSQGGGNTTISFTLESTPSTIFHIEIFDNPAPGAPAGRTYRGDTFLTTGPTGVASGSFTLGALTDHISLTATSPTNDTSEFSPIGSVPLTPAVTLSATSLNFGSVAVGSTSPAQTVTVSSVGNAPYQINTFDSNAMCYGGPFCSGGGFTCSTTCATKTAYAPGASCSISAAFSPSFTGPQTTTIYLCDNVAGSPRSITLTGDGVVPTTLYITPLQWDFGNVLVGAKSGAKTFLISNNGTSAAPIGPVSTTGSFTLESTNCGPEIPAGLSCVADVAFAPTLPGFASGDLVVPASSPAAKVTGAAASAPLTGNGVQNAQLDMPAAVAVGAYTLGNAPLSRTVTLTNSGNAVLTFSSIVASAPFTVVNNCPLNLQPGASCTVDVGFSAGAAGEFNGTLTVVSNAPGGSRAIPLSATAQLQPVPVVRIAPTFIGFGSRMIGTQSAPQRITIVNDGGVEATLGAMAAGVDYLIGGTSCGTTLASQATCFADVIFRPLGFGPRPGQFVFMSNSATSPHAIDLLGTGCRPFSMSNRSGASSACAP